MQIIEFSGISKSGKSALVKRLARFLSERGRVVIAEKGFRHCPFKNRDSVYYQQVWTVFSMINNLLELLNSDSPPDYIIMDRGFWDMRMFIEYFKNEDKITAGEYKYLCYVIGPYLEYVDKLVCIVTPPGVSIKRQRKEGISSRFSVKELEEINKITNKVLGKRERIELDGAKSLNELQSLLEREFDG
jgi:tRNA uridine 5-carbamoylmethylation protein Kti12